MIARQLLQELELVVRKSPATLLLGPRQVGKSTLMKALRPDHYINLSDEEIYLAHAKDAGRLKREIRAITNPALIAIDEVQRIPALLNTVQSIIDDSDGAYRFIISGSSARKLRHGSVNLLPGRIIQRELWPLTLSEIGNSFDLERAMRVGMLPGIYLNSDLGEDLLDSYAELYLREEIQREALVRNIGAFARFVDVMAVASGQWLNYSKLASDSEINKETLRSYVSVLEDSVMLFRLPSYGARSGSPRRVIQRERIYLFDIGVRNALVGLNHQSPPLTEIGHIFEQWFVLQVIYLARSLRKPWKLFSYLTENDVEIDLIVETDKKVICFEVKASAHVDHRKARNLRAFKKTMTGRKSLELILVHRGEHREIFDDGIHALPYQQALALLMSE